MLLLEAHGAVDTSTAGAFTSRSQVPAGVGVLFAKRGSMERLRSLSTQISRSMPVQVLLIAVVSRLALTFAAWYTLKLFPPPWEDHPRSLLAWAQWDAAHYARIALNGYDHPTDPGSPAFFPLYPLIVRFVGSIFGMEDTMQEVLVIGVIVSMVFFLLAVVLLTRLFEIHLGADVARTAGVLLLVSPFSFFLTTAYTESLFLVLVAMTFLLARRGLWLPAAIVVALATASRVPGVFLIPVLLYIAWRDRASLRQLALIALVSPLGLLSYMAYTWWALDDPLAFLTAQSGWGGFQDRTWIYVEGFIDHPLAWFLGDQGNPIMFLNVALFVIWGLSLIPMARLLPPENTLFSALVVLQTTFSIQSMGRYLLPAIGTYMVVALLIHRSRVPVILRDALVVPSAVLMTMLFLLFAEAEWVV